MQFIYNTVVPDCIALGSGLIANPEYVVIPFFPVIEAGNAGCLLVVGKTDIVLTTRMSSLGISEGRVRLGQIGSTSY